MEVYVLAGKRADAGALWWLMVIVVVAMWFLKVITSRDHTRLCSLKQLVARANGGLASCSTGTGVGEGQSSRPCALTPVRVRDRFVESPRGHHRTALA